MDFTYSRFLGLVYRVNGLAHYIILSDFLCVLRKVIPGGREDMKNIHNDRKP